MKMKRLIVSILALLVWFAPVRAGGPRANVLFPEPDIPKLTPYTLSASGASLTPMPSALKPHEGLFEGDFWQSRLTQVGFGLMGAGLVLMTADIQTYSLRGDYLPNFDYRYDDYLQFAPLALTYGLKLCGVESRSSWERMMVSDAISMGLMFATVHATKYIVGRLRPDGSTYNSFPSGHTASAFAAATILHKEYGKSVGPWLSIVGYSLAAVTGVSRMLNDRHWLSDVVVGAGVGILSSTLGYHIADRIYGSRGLLLPDGLNEKVHSRPNPSFLGIGIAHNALIYDCARYERLAKSGVGFNIEGAWFFSPHLGVGGEAKVGRYASLLERGSIEGGRVVEPKPLNSLSLSAGLYYNHPLGRSERLHIMAKTLIGVSHNHYMKNSVVDDYGEEIAAVEFGNREHLTFVSGVSLRWLATNYLGVRLSVDYNHLRTDYTITHRNTSGATTSSSYNRPLSFGVAVDAMLW